MKWLNCNNSLVALDKVCYIEFSEEDGVPTAMIYFMNRRRPLVIQAESMEDLIGYFHNNTIGNDHDATEASPGQG